MKRILSFLLAAVMLFSLFGCVKKSSHAEEFLIAARGLDFDAMYSHFDPIELSLNPGGIWLDRFATYYQNMNEEEKAVALSLYSLLQYTIGGESAVEDGANTMEVTLKLPDFARIRSLAQANILVSGKTAEELVSEMIEDGSIAKNYMTEKKIKVKMTESKTDGEFYVSFSERDNAELIEALSLSEMLRFFASN